MVDRIINPAGNGLRLRHWSAKIELAIVQIAAQSYGGVTSILLDAMS